MKVLKWLFIGIAGLALVVVAVGFALPSSYMVTRSVDINAAPDKVYPLIADPKAWAKWGVWSERDPAMKTTYSGAPEGQGAKWAWESKSEGNGSMEFTRAEPGKALEYALSFPDMGMKSKGALLLEPAGAATRVTWTNAGDVGGNPLMHYFAVMMDDLVGPDFDKGLANLKALAEKP